MDRIVEFVETDAISVDFEFVDYAISGLTMRQMVQLQYSKWTYSTVDEVSVEAVLLVVPLLLVDIFWRFISFRLDFECDVRT